MGTGNNNRDGDDTAAANETPPHTPAGDAPEQPGRRDALGKLVMAGSAAYACALAVPAAAFVVGSAPAPTRGGNFHRIAPLESLPDGKPTRVKISGDQRDAFTLSRDQVLGSVWLLRKGKTVSALSAECPHLGCAVDVSDDGYGCPCHTSSFELSGKAKSGPSPRDMDSLPSRLSKDGWVEVEFRRYRQGVADKVVVG